MRKKYHGRSDTFPVFWTSVYFQLLSLGGLGDPVSSASGFCLILSTFEIVNIYQTDVFQ